MKDHHTPRTYNEDGYRLRGGCVCYRDEKKDQILLISSPTNPLYWKVPGGGIDPGENAKEAAVREVYEEAGAVGELDQCIGVFQDDGKKTLTYMYSMIVTQLGPSLEGKNRKWFSANDAAKELSKCHKPHKPLQLSYISDNVHSEEEYCKLMADSEVRHY